MKSKIAMHSLFRLAAIPVAVSLAVATMWGRAAQPVLARAKQERAAFIETLALVGIESGSRDIEGLDRISELIAIAAACARWRRPVRCAGYERRVRRHAGADRPHGAGAIQGHGARGASCCWRTWTRCIEGDGREAAVPRRGHRAYGLGIADDKQGVALILHTIAMLKALKFKVRPADGADQWRRGDQFARGARRDHTAGARARRGAVV